MTVRTGQPLSTATEIGRTPCTRNSPDRCRLVRLVSEACHTWNRAFRDEIRCTASPYEKDRGAGRRQLFSTISATGLPAGAAVVHGLDTGLDLGLADTYLRSGKRVPYFPKLRRRAL